MKQKFTLGILFSFFSLFLFGQADLIVTNNFSVQTTNVSIGNYLTFKFRVRNNGNIVAPKSHTLIYVSPTTNITANSVELTTISTEALAANTETQDINYTYPLPFNCTSGTNYIIIQVDSRNEVVESNEANYYYLPTTITVNSTIVGQQNLPYPIIFIHGLNSDNKTWDNLLIDFQKFYGWSFGGNLNYCLNQSATSTYKYDDYKPRWSDTLSLTAADFYTINFDVDRNGTIHPTSSTTVLSNQAAIVKQGLAVKDAIKYVLKKTGRDKVILVGHSMGGLASREYLQNSSLWQPDNKHHVAKLLTVGTPHGGSNASLSALALITSINGTTPDEHSEAIRDLKTSYFYSLQPGVYLFGGTEDYATMNDILLANFYNVDVNCDGIDNSGVTIQGLNQKSISNTLNYSCIIGDGIIVVDGVVYAANANLKNYYNTLPVDTFIVSALHTALPKQTETIVKGLDESNEYSRSYDIKTSQIYFGNFSTQSQDPSSYPYDYDDYKFSVPQNGVLNIKVYNITLPKCYINLLDSTQNIIYKDSTNGQGYWELNRTLNTGKYYFEVFGNTDAKAWRNPYAFKLSFTPTLPVTLLDFVATLKDNQTFLKWTATNEINTAIFTIEKSINGVEWAAIGNVNAVNMFGINNYNFNDANPNFGINYYRLKMIDKDGKFTYSEVRTVELNKPKNSLFVVAPNPAKGHTTLFSKSIIKNAVIEIYNVEGSLLLKQNATDSYKVDLDISKLPQGFYLVKIIDANNSVNSVKMAVY